MSIPVIIGGGLAGLSVALSLAPRPVVVIARRMASSLTSSELAQGGIACALGEDDSPLLHEQDTILAGAGLCDPDMTRLVTQEGPKAIEQLAAWGVVFDKAENGKLALGLEGAHGRRRIVHANGDSTGASVMTALVEKVRQTPSITVIGGGELRRILTDDRGVCGVLFAKEGEVPLYHLPTRSLVMASGSASSLWRHATVPTLSWGHGLLLAARAGARLRDLEFLQFHPTALDCGLDPMPLISEALRGEGARLVNERGERFVEELSPRDIVARANWDQLSNGHRVFLDARSITPFSKRFPTILEFCLKAGVNPREDLIPIRPVAHYHMGGIATDGMARTQVQGLYACGEAACTGLHGANRLASNSLLEAVVMGCRLAHGLAESYDVTSRTPVPQVTQEVESLYEEAEICARVRTLMMAQVGLIRREEGLSEAVVGLEELAAKSSRAQVGLMIAKAALARTESRGAHYRADYPSSDPAQAASQFVSLNQGKIEIEKGRVSL
ncbi:MAG: L-aspartate oxidase [Bdellovibrionales bacterium]